MLNKRMESDSKISRMKRDNVRAQISKTDKFSKTKS